MTANHQQKMIPQDAAICGHYVIQAKMTTESPLVMGAGEGSDVDKIITRDSKKEPEPIISGSAFIGCLKLHIMDIYNMANLRDPFSLEYFWGSDETKKEETSQSHLQFCPIKTHSKISVQTLDGIKISHSTGVVEPKAKYDFECINHAATFTIGFEIVMRIGMNPDDFNYLVSCVKDCFSKGYMRLGAYTALGFGKVKFDEKELKIQHFTYPDHALAWFTYRRDETVNNDFTPVEVSYKQDDSLKINCLFQLKSSMMTGAAAGSGESDKTHYHFDEKPALLGRAVKGAISHRMNKILRTVSHQQDGFLDTLLGYGNLTNNIGQQSRLQIELALFEKVKTVLQDRIKIDRFLQSTIDGAKFDSEPIWDDGDSVCNIVIKISNPKSWEGGTIMHIIKDLWTSDMAIGGEKNIGRGIMIGKKVQISHYGKTASITSTGQDSIEIADSQGILKEFNKAFNQKVKGIHEITTH